MRFAHFAFMTAFAVFALICPVWAERPIDWNDRQILWHSYENGLEVSSRTGRNVLLVIYTDWCPDCKRLSRYFQDSDVVDLSRRLVMVRFNADDAPDLSYYYGPDGEYIPRVMVLKPDGSLVTELSRDSGEYRYYVDSDSDGALSDLMRRAVQVR